jgi:RNA polymerase sigma-70 factor, ECF subfamily
MSRSLEAGGSDIIDPAAPWSLDDLFDAHYERVTRVIGRVIHDQARAEEIAVEVFLKWNRNPKAHGSGAEGWIYRTATREALDELRRQLRRRHYEKVFAAILPKAPQTPEQIYETDRERDRVRTVLTAINGRMASLLLLWSEGLSYREMAAALDIQLNYAGSLLSRAQEAFRKEYRKRYGTESE